MRKGGTKSILVCLVNIYVSSRGCVLEIRGNIALQKPFFEQNIKVGLVCLKTQMKKTQKQSGEKNSSAGRPRNSDSSNVSLIMHRLFQICLQPPHK